MAGYSFRPDRLRGYWADQEAVSRPFCLDRCVQRHRGHAMTRLARRRAWSGTKNTSLP